MSAQTQPVNTWIVEALTPYDHHHHGVVEILTYKRTAFQEMWIVNVGAYGKALILDRAWQSSTGDEFLYHEALVHPACVNHGAPQRVLVLGGGEGATVREVLKWRTVQEVVMVDIDGEVVEACRQHLPEMHQGAFDDPRTQVVIADALDYLDAATPAWDIIISDLVDPVEEGPSFNLFTKEYFEQCRQALRPNGYLVVQAGPYEVTEQQMHVRLVKTLAAVFPHVASYSSYVPTFGSRWGFILASQQPIALRPDPDQTDALLAAKTTGVLRMFDGISLLGMLQTPKYLRTAIANESKIYTKADPPKFWHDTGTQA